MKSHRLFHLFLLSLALAPGLRPVVSAQDQDPIEIEKARGRFIPVALEGFTGVAGSALRFDLEVAGFEVTSTENAQYLISGSNNGSLTGRVTDRVSKQTLLSKEYTGGNPRSQAHTFSDDIVQLFPGRRGIARTRIAFIVENDARTMGEVYVCDYDGYNLTRVTQDNALVKSPAWVPGRRALYYTSYKSGSPAIYSHDLQNGQRRLVSGATGQNSGAAISPDGRKVAMILSKNGSPDLYVADADGGNLRQLTHTKQDESSPCWSPDGRTLCFVSRMNGRPELYLVDAAGGPVRRLPTVGVLNTTEPDWSPDGKQIVFTANMSKICTVPAAGGTATVLVAGTDPSWAPNSRTVVFNRRVGGRQTVSLLDVPTKRVKDVTQISSSCSQPVWAK